MLRQPGRINAPWQGKKNERRFTEAKEEASFLEQSEDKICRGTKFKLVKASKKENLSNGSKAQLPDYTLKLLKGLEKGSRRGKEGGGSCQRTGFLLDRLERDVAGEHNLPLNSKENFSCRPVSLGDQCYLTPNKAEGKSDCGTPEEHRTAPVDPVTVTMAEFGITQHLNQSMGKSALRYRRRSGIGVRGSPENNTLIRFLAQQRSSKQKEAFTLVSPFKHERVMSLKHKIDAFRKSFTSEAAAGRESGRSGLSPADGAAQEAGSSQDKVPLTEEREADQGVEEFTSDNSRADLKENLRQSLTISDFSPDPITKNAGSNVVSDISREKLSFAEELSLDILDETKPPVTPVRTGRAPFSNCSQSGSHLRSILKKTPVKQLMSGVQEHLADAADRIGGESLTVSPQTAERTESRSSEKSKKRRVTFAAVLSPVIFDASLPVYTPVHKGETPVQSSSPWVYPSLAEEPLSQPDFDCCDECVEPLQDLEMAPVAAEDLSPVEKAAAAEGDKPDGRQTCSSMKRKCNTASRGADGSVSEATDTKSCKDTKNPRKTKIQRRKNTTTATQKSRKTKRSIFGGKRRKRKVDKSLYGVREMASKKPLLSPIPEVPETFFVDLSPNLPKMDAFFPEDALLDDAKFGNAHQDVQHKTVVERMRGKNMDAVQTCGSSKDLNVVKANSSRDTECGVLDDGLKSAPGLDHQCDFDPSDCPHQGRETVCVREAEESDSLIKSKKFQGHLLKAELLTELELPQQDTSAQEGAQRAWCPQNDSVGDSLPQTRRSSAIYFPPVEKLEVAENSHLVSSYNVEEIFSASRPGKDSFEPFRRASDKSGEKSVRRSVRRSMRLHKDAEAEGLVWVQVPSEIQPNPPLLASARKIRRRSSIHRKSENIHQSEQNLTQPSALGTESDDCRHFPDGSCESWSRRAVCVSTPQERRASSQRRKRSLSSVYRKDTSSPECSEKVETPFGSN